MPDSFLIKPFLEQHRAEMKNMLLTEYNEAETLEMFKVTAQRRHCGTPSSALWAVEGVPSNQDSEL